MSEKGSCFREFQGQALRLKPLFKRAPYFGGDPASSAESRVQLNKASSDFEHLTVFLPAPNIVLALVWLVPKG